MAVQMVLRLLWRCFDAIDAIENPVHVSCGLGCAAGEEVGVVAVDGKVSEYGIAADVDRYQRRCEVCETRVGDEETLIDISHGNEAAVDIRGAVRRHCLGATDVGAQGCGVTGKNLAADFLSVGIHSLDVVDASEQTTQTSDGLKIRSRCSRSIGDKISPGTGVA